MTIEIMYFPSYKMVIFHSYVSLPEGKYPIIIISSSSKIKNIEAN